MSSLNHENPDMRQQNINENPERNTPSEVITITPHDTNHKFAFKTGASNNKFHSQQQQQLITDKTIAFILMSAKGPHPIFRSQEASEN